MKKIFIFLIFTNFVFANTELAEEEVLRQTVQEINLKSKNYVEKYYNRQAKLLTDQNFYDTRFRFEKVKSGEEVLANGTEIFYYDSGIENEIGIRPQIFTSSKLRYTLTPEALRSLNPREPSNYQSNRAEGDPPSLYNIVMNVLSYRLMLEHRNKLQHNKYADIKGIKDISFFNTCQFPVVTSREARYSPVSRDDSGTVNLAAQFGQASNYYQDYVTYNSPAYNQYVDWLAAQESPLVNEQKEVSFLDYLNYYKTFQRSDEELLDVVFSDEEGLTADKFATKGEYTLGYVYTRFNYPSEATQQERRAFMYKGIELLDQERFPDSTDLAVDDTLVARVSDEVLNFANSSVHFNPNGDGDEMISFASASPGAGYSLRPLKGSPRAQGEGVTPGLGLKIQGFYCEASASLTPLGSNANLLATVDAVNTQLNALVDHHFFSNYVRAIENAKITEADKEVCKADGDNCNVLLAKLRRSKCFLTSIKTFMKIMTENKYEELRELFAQGTPAEGTTVTLREKLAVDETNITHDAVISANAQSIASGTPFTIYQGSSQSPRGMRYISCEVGVDATGPLRGFQRRDECNGNEESLRNYANEDNPNLVQAVQRAIDKVLRGEIPAASDFNLIKDTFYRPDQFAKLGIIYSIESQPEVNTMRELACVDAIGIRFYGEDADGLGDTPPPADTSTAENSPVNNRESFLQMIDSVEQSSEIPNCNEVDTGVNANVAKYELRHCHRLLRNLGLRSTAGRGLSNSN